MSHITIDLDQGTGPLSTYNSLTDNHLTGYFSSPRKRKHLRNVGLINRSGHLISENTFRLNMARKEHKRHIKNTLAQAIVEKTLELERQRQNVIKQKLEEIAKLELVHRVRASEKRRRDVEDILPYLSPRSPRRPVSGPAPSKPGGSPKGKYRPISAPENNRPESGSTKTSTNYDEDDDDDVEYLDENGRPISPPRNGEFSQRNETVDFSQLYTLNTAALRKYAMTLARLEQNRGGSSPYVTSQIPIPPRSPRIVSSSARSRRYNGTGGNADRSPTRRTANGQVYLHHTESITTHPGQLQSMVEIRMKYHGWTLSLARDEIDPRNLVVIEQQHCGGNTLTVYKEKLLPKTDFTFMSHRHRGYPFSLTIYVDGRMDSRVSTCCEYRHGKNVRLGGANGHFSIMNVKGNGPCYKCRVARGGKKKKKQKSKPETATEEVTVVETYPVSENVSAEKDKQQNGESNSESEGQQIIVPVENGDETSRTNDGEKDIDTGNYDDDFEDSDAEPKEKKNEENRRGHESRRKHKKTKRSGNLDYSFMNPSDKERGKDWTTNVEKNSDDSVGTGPSYTFLKNERSDTQEVDNENSDNPLREITINDDKWIITVKGPPEERRSTSSTSSEPQDVVLNKDNKSRISLKGAEAEESRSSQTPADKSKREKPRRIKSAKKGSTRAHAGSPISSVGSQKSNSIVDTREITEEIQRQTSPEIEDIAVFGSKPVETNNSINSEESDTESTIKSRSSSSLESSSGSRTMSKKRNSSSDGRKEKTSHEDEIQSAEELLKELENEINTADEVSDIETEADSPRRQPTSPGRPGTSLRRHHSSPQRKVTFREEVSFASDIHEKSESILEMCSDLGPGEKKVNLISKDIYRSRENLSLSDSEDDSQNSFRKTQHTTENMDNSPLSNDSLGSRDRNKISNSNDSSEADQSTKVTSMEKKNNMPTDVTMTTESNEPVEKPKVRSTIEHQSRIEIQMMAEEEETPRIEVSNSDLRGDEFEPESPKQQNSSENDVFKKKSDSQELEVDEEIDNFLKECMNEAKDLVGNQTKLITEEHKDLNEADDKTNMVKARDVSYDSSSDDEGATKKYSRQLNENDENKDGSSQDVNKQILERKDSSLKSSLRDESAERNREIKSVTFGVDQDGDDKNMSNSNLICDKDDDRNKMVSDNKSVPTFVIEMDSNSKTDDTDDSSSESSSSDDSSSDSSSDDEDENINDAQSEERIDSQMTNFSNDKYKN